jgi:hypothetical protein
VPDDVFRGFKEFDGHETTMTPTVTSTLAVTVVTILNVARALTTATTLNRRPNLTVTTNVDAVTTLNATTTLNVEAMYLVLRQHATTMEATYLVLQLWALWRYVVRERTRTDVIGLDAGFPAHRAV